MNIHNKPSVLYAYSENVVKIIATQSEGISKKPKFILKNDKNLKEVIDLTSAIEVRFNAQKPDGHNVYNLCTVEDAENGIVSFEITNQMTVCEGTVKGEIEVVYSGAENIKFSGIYIKVLKGYSDCSQISENEIQLINSIIEKLHNLETKTATFEKVYCDVGGTGGINQADDPNIIYIVQFNVPSGEVPSGTKGIMYATEYTQVVYSENGEIYYRYYDTNTDCWYNFNKVMVSASNVLFSDNETFQQKYDNDELRGQDGKSGVYVGTEFPDDPDVKVFIDLNGEADSILTEKDKQDIADIVINEFTNQAMAILGDDEYE